MKDESIKILIIALIISAIGVATIFSSTYQKPNLMMKQLHKRQLVWITLGLILFFIFSHLSYRRLRNMAFIFYALTLLLLLAVWMLGVVRLGAQRWLRIAWFNFQPSEFAKLTTVIFLSFYFSRKSEQNLLPVFSQKGLFTGFVLPFIYIAVFMVLIMEQPDLGSALLLLIIFLLIAFLAQVRWKYLVLFLILGIMSLPVFWHMLRDYQKQRLLVFLNPNLDPLGAGYTIIQSKIALGSGGFWGKGWLSGTQSQLNFLPESHTDFIFAAFAEQWGFVGCFVLLALYYLLLRQGFKISFRTSEIFARLTSYGITFMLGIQILINISMNLGLAPVVGIPLPLMSYGGSSVVTTFASLGILANISKSRQMY